MLYLPVVVGSTVVEVNVAAVVEVLTSAVVVLKWTDALVVLG